MLIGIVKKNAIMMIDFALEAQRNESKSPHDAIYDGCIIFSQLITLYITPVVYTYMDSLQRRVRMLFKLFAS